MMSSVYLELWGNKSALQSLKDANIETITVGRFEARAAANSLSNPMFVRHLTKDQYMYLNGYVGGIATMNNYQELAEKYILSDRPDKRERLLYLRQEWNRDIGISENAISELLKGQSPPR